MRRLAACLIVAGVGLTGCSDGGSTADTTLTVAPELPTPTTSRSTTTTTPPPTSSASTTTEASPATTAATTSAVTSGVTTTTVTTTTIRVTTTSSTTPPPTSTVPATTTTVAPPAGQSVPAIAPIDALSFPNDVEVEIGRSVEGRPITVIRRGTPGGVGVLAVGAIHGNEADGVAIIDRLAVEPVPDGVDLWLVRSMNPDGQARQDRQNANAVDLNRNFPQNWDVLGEPGFWQYGGSGPASEPETQAMVALGESIRPAVILWYHQDLFRIAPGSGRAGEIRTRYAQVAGLPIVDITGGTYTGTASQWSRTVLPDTGVGITVELGSTLSEAEIVAHVEAVHTVAREYF